MPSPLGGLQLSKEVLVANRPDPRVEERKKETCGDPNDYPNEFNPSVCSKNTKENDLPLTEILQV